MMKIFKSKILIVALMLFSIASFGQSRVKGILVDAKTNEVLIGASVVVEGTTIGTATALDGSFKIDVPSGNQKMSFSYVGYIEQVKDITVVSGQELNLGKMGLESDAVNINEVRVVASVAIARETPVAVSTISPMQIAEKLGNQEYPEILKSTPGVYTSKQGGAFGDSRINIRGFDNRNTATMINGVPVNDMENGLVYWSNWAGLSDVTRSMQLQRGLGASKVAVPSLGGTLNILTYTTENKTGGNAFATVGQDGYNKYGFTLSSGLTENNWATTISLSKSEGDGFVDGTQFESYSYFLNISKRINDKHSFAFSLFGAPQWHGQRSSDMYISEYENSPRGIKYNQDWGYKNGEVYYVRKNFYHKPQAILNHFWTVNETTSVITALYASIGTGGGTGNYGNTSYYSGVYLRDGQVDFDFIYDLNKERGNLGSETILRSSNNNHKWYGLISTATKEMGNLDFFVGVDGRYYEGEHYREVTDLLGGDFYIDVNQDANNPNKVVREGDRIDYYNIGVVGWLGLFAQAEYKLDKLSSFVSLAVSDKSYKRYDYFSYVDTDPLQKTGWQNFIGYQIKGGANYKLTDQHNVFFNAGYFERQPDFDAVFLNFVNFINKDAVNEKVLSFELGYGYQSRFISANLNAYYTNWGDKTFSKGQTVVDIVTSERKNYTANILGVDATHMGVELDFVAKPIQKLDIKGFVSIGDWRWLNNIEDVDLLDDQQNPIRTFDLYLKDVRVGDAAQTTLGLGVDYELLKGLKVGADVNYYDNLYADFDVLGRTTLEADENPNSWKVPYYTLVDMNLRYNFDVSNMNATLFCNVQNLFDNKYISDAYDGTTHDWNSARVYYGWGRSWSVGLKIRF